MRATDPSIKTYLNDILKSVKKDFADADTDEMFYLSVTQQGIKKITKKTVTFAN